MLAVVFKHVADHVLRLGLLPFCLGVEVHRLKHEVFQLCHGLGHLRGLVNLHSLLAIGHNVQHQPLNALPVGEAQHLGDVHGDVGGVDDAAPHGVVNVVVDVGDLVGVAHQLPLQGLRHRSGGVAENAVPHLIAQVQPGAVPLQAVHHPQGLLIVAEAPLHHPAQRPLSGVAKGGVAQIVGQGGGLGEVLVQPQRPGHAPGNSRHLQGVGHTGAVVVPLRLEEYLGLVHQPPKGLGVHHPVHIPLKTGAHGTGRDVHRPPFGLGSQAGPGRENLSLQLLGIGTNFHLHPSYPIFPITIYSISGGNPSFYQNFLKNFFIPLLSPP